MTRTPNETLQRLGALTFGTELEYNRIGRRQAAEAIQSVVGGRVEYAGHSIGYDAWTCVAPDGRVWKAVRDGSLSGEHAEVVTPILKLADMETLQKVVRALRRAGAKATREGGMHVHVGARHMNATQLGNLVKLFYRQEELIVKATRTLPARLGWYTRPTDRDFLREIERRHPKTMDRLNEIWFGRRNLHPDHYDSHRYRTLNLNNLWGSKGTVEFRLFNATTHAGEVRTNVLLALALVDTAMTAKAASAKRQRPYDERTAKYDLRTFLLRIGFIGDFFKNPREHLLGHLGGSAAWKGERRDTARAGA